ncbi:MAG: T9SS type A sorting domain-containing protein [Chitinophagales bacterium]
MKHTLLSISALLVSTILIGQPSITFTQTLGGAGVDIIKDMVTDNEGNIIALCRTDSLEGDVNCTLHGKKDVWLVKMDAVGNILKQQCFGGSDDDDPYQLMQTHDGGLLFTCNTFSNDGDVSGNHGSQDTWVVKLDSAWIMQWQRCIGGTAGEYVYNSVQLHNNKYAINCATLSSNGDFPLHYGGYLSQDAWIVVLNTDGSIDTALLYGGSGDDKISEIIELPDHDWQVFGITQSTDFDLSGTTSFGFIDAWVFRTDSNGSIKWTKRLGGNSSDFLETAYHQNNCFLTAGSTSSTLGIFSSTHGAPDLWIMKLDSIGNLVENYLYGGSGGETSTYRMRFEQIDSIHLSLGAYSYSNDGQVGLNHGYSDYWAIKLDTNGVLLSSVVAGGTYYDDTHCNTISNISDICLGGLTLSNDTDVQDYNGNGDGWLVRISDYNSVQTAMLEYSVVDVFPNPVEGEINVCLTGPPDNEAWFELFSIEGWLVFRKKVTGCSNVFSQHLTAGLYQYIVQHQDKVLGKGKLIVQ